MIRIAIIDYGMGNLYSVQNALKHFNIKADIISSPERLSTAEKVILPGVGAFGDAMRELKNRDLVAPIKRFIEEGKPFLGICLGMHLLMDRSEELKGVAGLGLIAGDVKRFSQRVRCPHMGWNRIEELKKKCLLFSGVLPDPYVYFCHSFYVRPKDKRVVVAKTRYGVSFASVVNKGNVFGMQFHPEKSQDEGLKLLKNFVTL